MSGEDDLTTAKVAVLADVSRRQLDYWVHRGFFPGVIPHGSGRSFRWPPADVARAVELARLLGDGYTLEGAVGQLSRRVAADAVWRVGRKVGRTLYVQVGAEPSDGDVLVGVMDTAELARRVVEAVNAGGPR